MSPKVTKFRCSKDGSLEVTLTQEDVAGLRCMLWQIFCQQGLVGQGKKIHKKGLGFNPKTLQKTPLKSDFKPLKSFHKPLPRAKEKSPKIPLKKRFQRIINSEFVAKRASNQKSPNPTRVLT